MAYHADGPTIAAGGNPSRRILPYSTSTWGLALAGGAGLVALLVALLAVMGGQSAYVLGGVLVALAVAGAFALRGYRAAAGYVAASVAFGLIVLTVANTGSASLTLLLLPLFLVGVGMLLSARAALIFGVLSVVAYDFVAFVQAQRPLAFAEQISGSTFVARALVGTLALAATTLLVNAGVRRWEAVALREARRVEGLLAALEVGLKTTAFLDVDEMLNRVVILICQQFGYQHAQIFLLDRDGERAVLRASTGDEGQHAVARGHAVALGSTSVVGQVLAGAGPIVALDTDTDEVRQNNELLPANRSELALPLGLGGRIIGALDVQSSLPHAFASEDIEALQKAAEQVARAVENALALAEEAGFLQEEGPAMLAARELALAADIGEAISILRRHVAGEFDRVSVVRLDSSPAGEVVPATLGVWDREDLAPYGVTFDALGLDTSDGAPRVIGDAAGLGDEDAPLKELLGRLRAGSFAAFPLKDAKRNAGLTGYLLLYRRDARPMFDDEIRTFQALGGQLAVLVENLRVAERASQQSERLTILNELTSVIAGMLDLDEVSREVAVRVRRLLRYEHLSVARLDEAGKTASLHVLSTSADDYVGSRMFPLEGTAVGAVMDRGHTMVAPDLSDTTFKDFQAWRAEGVQGALVTPLRTRDRILGTLNAGFLARETPAPEDIAALEQVAAQLAVALDNAQLVESERRRREETAALLDIAEAMGSTLELRILLKQISIRTAQVCEVDRCTVFLHDKDADVLRPLMSQFADGHDDPRQWEAIRSMSGVSVDAGPIFRQTLRERVPFVLEDASQEDVLPHMWTETFGVQKLLCVPLVRRDEAIGVFVLDYTRPDRRFSQKQIDLATTIGSQVAASVENALLFEQLQESLTETTALYNASLALSAAEDTAALLETGAQEIAHLSGADRVRVYVAGPDAHGDVRYLDEVIQWWRERDDSGKYQAGRHVTPEEVAPLGDYPMSRSNVLVNDLSDSPQLSQPTRRALKLKGVESLALVPLVAGVTWLGAVVLEKYDPRGFSEESIRWCRNLADQTALALNAQLLLEASRRTATHEMVLREISGRLRQAPDVETVLQVAVEELGKALGAASGSAYLGPPSEDGEPGRS